MEAGVAAAEEEAGESTSRDFDALVGEYGAWPMNRLSSMTFGELRSQPLLFPPPPDADEATLPPLLPPVPPQPGGGGLAARALAENFGTLQNMQSVGIFWGRTAK